MIDIEKHIAYWKNGAEEDLDVAKRLISDGKFRHGLFFAHLALEKYFKALVCHHTGNPAPRIHNLTRLCDISGIKFSDEKRDFLAEMNQFNIMGRYPEILFPAITNEDADYFMTHAEEAFQWLVRQL